LPGTLANACWSFLLAPNPRKSTCSKVNKVTKAKRTWVEGIAHGFLLLRPAPTTTLSPESAIKATLRARFALWISMDTTPAAKAPAKAAGKKNLRKVGMGEAWE